MRSRCARYRWLQGPAITCRRTDPSSSASRSSFDVLACPHCGGLAVPDRHAPRSSGHPEDPRAPRCRPLGAEPGPALPSPALPRRTPSCWRREVAFVLIRPVHRSIDGGGPSGLACRSPGPARSTREKVADVRCGIGSCGVPRPSLGGYGTRRGPRVGDPPPAGVDVAYPLSSGRSTPCDDS